MRVLLPATILVSAFVLMASGCKRSPSGTATQAPAPSKPAGRLVPAVVASFERGLGGWQVERSGNAGGSQKPEVAQGEAARGEHWLAVPASASGSGETVLDVWGNVPSGDWSRFGDTLRADVRVVPGGVKATVEPYVVTPDGKETLGPKTEVTSAWKTVSWNAGAALGNIGRIGLRWRLSGDWTGRLGVDNVRVGAADALTTAYSVVSGPFANRDVASEAMKLLAKSDVKSFPIYEQGWYLNLGTFSTKAAAEKEAERFKGQGLKVTVLTR